MAMLWSMPCPQGPPPPVTEDMVRAMRVGKRQYMHYLLGLGAVDRALAYSEAWERVFGKVTG